MAPSDGVFVGPQEAAVVSASVIHKKQTKSFEKAACVKKESPDWYNFTGIPFLSDYQPEHCVSLCYAQECQISCGNSTAFHIFPNSSERGIYLFENKNINKKQKTKRIKLSFL